jgi:hypothetical protein
MSLGGGPRLVYTITADAANATTQMQSFGFAMQQVSQETTTFTSTLQNAGQVWSLSGSIIKGHTTAVTQSVAAWEKWARGLSYAGYVARTALGMYTQYTVWQIRLAQYTEQVREAQQRLNKIQEQIKTTTGGLVLQLSDYNRIQKDLIQSTLQSEKSQISSQRSTSNLFIAFRRFGAGSAEAKDSMLEWKDEMVSTAEQQRRMGTGTEEITANLARMRDQALEGIPASQRSSAAGVSAANSIRQGYDLAVESMKTTITTMDELSAKAEEHSKKVVDTQTDLAAARMKEAAAMNEQIVMYGFMLIEIVGIAAQTLLFLKTMGALPAVIDNALTALVRGRGAMAVTTAAAAAAPTTGAAAGAAAGGAAGWGTVAPSVGGPVAAALTTAETIASVATPVMLFALAAWWASIPKEERRQMALEQAPDVAERAAWEQQYGLSTGEDNVGIGGNYPNRQVGGMIPTTGRYEMEAGEIVTPPALAGGGYLIPQAEKAAGAGSRETHYHFGDINFNNPVIQNSNDMRRFALEFRKYIEMETSRTR